MYYGYGESGKSRYAMFGHSQLPTMTVKNWKRRLGEHDVIKGVESAIRELLLNIDLGLVSVSAGVGSADEDLVSLDILMRICRNG